MVPGPACSSALASTTGNVVRRPSTLAITVSCRRSRCWTTTTGTGNPAGSDPSTRLSAVIPPADAAMATMPYGFAGPVSPNSRALTPAHLAGSVGSGRVDSRTWAQRSDGRPEIGLWPVQHGAHPVVERSDVAFGRDQYAAVAVGAGTHRRLAAFARREVLQVDPVEQFHRMRQIAAVGDHVPGVQPVAFDHGAVRRQRVHPVQDHVVRHQIDEHLRFDGDRVVPPVLVRGHAAQFLETGAAVHGETVDPFAEFRAVADIILRGIAVREFWQDLGEFGVDRGAVVALHEILDDEN